MEDMKCQFCGGRGYIGNCSSESCICFYCSGLGFVPIEYSHKEDTNE